MLCRARTVTTVSSNERATFAASSTTTGRSAGTQYVAESGSPAADSGGGGAGGIDEVTLLSLTDGYGRPEGTSGDPAHPIQGTRSRATHCARGTALPPCARHSRQTSAGGTR